MSNFLVVFWHTFCLPVNFLQLFQSILNTVLPTDSTESLIPSFLNYYLLFIGWYSYSEEDTVPMNQHQGAAEISRARNAQVREQFCCFSFSRATGEFHSTVSNTHNHHAHLTHRMTKTCALYFLISTELQCQY